MPLPITTDILSASPISGSVNGSEVEKHDGEGGGGSGEGSEETGEEEEESDDDDEEDEEPTLKYEKLQQDAAKLFEGKDSASALAVSSQSIVRALYNIIVTWADIFLDPRNSRRHRPCPRFQWRSAKVISLPYRFYPGSFRRRDR